MTSPMPTISRTSPSRTTAYGRYGREVTAAEGALVVDGRRITALAERDPANLPWADLDVDLVLECTGAFTTAEDLAQHVEAGASYVILSAPTKSEARAHRGARREQSARSTPDHLLRELHHSGSLARTGPRHRAYICTRSSATSGRRNDRSRGSRACRQRRAPNLVMVESPPVSSPTRTTAHTTAGCGSPRGARDRTSYAMPSRPAA